MKIRIPFFLLFFIIPSFIWGQDPINLTGYIIDGKTKEPLEGAHIFVLKQENLGTFSDKSGAFNISTASDSLIVTFLGYRDEKIAIKGKGSFFKIELFPTGSTILQTVEVRSSSIALSKPLGLGLLQQNEIIIDDGISIRNGMNRIPGVFMQSGTFNTNRISIRGVGSRSAFGTSKIRLYLDDIPLTTGDGSSAIEDIDPLLIQEIMVIKGPTAGSFGGGLGGVIQLKTESGSGELGTQFKSGYQVGSFQTNRFYSGFSHQAKDYSLSLNYTKTTSEGFRENSQFNREAFFGIFDIQSGERHQTKFIFSHIDNKAFIPSSINLKDYTEAPQKAASNWLAIRGFEDYRQFTAGFTHRISLSKESSDFQWNAVITGFFGFGDNYEPRPFNTLRDNNQVLGTRTYFSGISSTNSALKAIRMGIEGYREHFLWTTHRASLGQLVEQLSDNEEYRKYVNIFSEAEWNIGKKWFLLTGLNLNRTQFLYTDHFLKDQINQSGNKNFNPVFSPRISLGYFVSNTISVYGGASHGFSPPSLEESLLPEGGVNQGIQPERGWMLEVGTKGSVLGGKFEYDFTVYRLNVFDLLVARRLSDDQYLGINAGRTIHFGIESMVRAYPFSFLEAYFSHHFTQYKFGDFVDGEKDYTGNQLTGVAPNTVTGGLVFGKETGFFANINFEYLDKMPMRDDNSIYSDSYFLTNFKTGYGLNWKGWGIRVFGGLNNIFDKKYAGMILVNAASFGAVPPRYYYPGLPRNTYAGFEIKYRF